MTTKGNTERRTAPAGFLSRGFRPFFLGSTVLAAVAIPLWVAAYSGWLAFAQGALTLEWHTHELIFGYTGGVVAGFALTAVPNWTGRLPVSGRPLAGLFALWIIGRLALLSAPWIGAGAAAVLDVAFPVALSGYLLREIIAAGNLRNLPIAGLVSALALANVFWHTARIVEWDVAIAERCGLAVVALLISIVGGRVTPSFTHNWLMKTGRAAAMPMMTRLDKLALAVTAAALAAWAAAPQATATGLLLLAAGAALAARLSRWRGWQTVSEPLVLILHIGYLWMAAALVLLGLSAVWPDHVDPQSALHALSAGAIGTMTLAVMTRAALGHTGSPLTAGGATIVIYILVTAGALLRLVSGMATESYVTLLIIAGAMWSGAFALFVVSYGPCLVRPLRPVQGRVDETD